MQRNLYIRSSQTSHHGRSLCTCRRRSTSLRNGRPSGWLCTRPPHRPPPVPEGNLPDPCENTGSVQRKDSGRENTAPRQAYSPPSRMIQRAHTKQHAPECFVHMCIHQERRLIERKQPMRGRLSRSSQPVRHLLQASFAGSVVGLSNSSATGGPM